MTATEYESDAAIATKDMRKPARAVHLRTPRACEARATRYACHGEASKGFEGHLPRVQLEVRRERGAARHGGNERDKIDQTKG